MDFETLAGQGKWSEALMLIDESLREKDDDSELLLKRGVALFHLDRLEEAEESLTKAYNIGGAADTLFNLMVVRHLVKDYEGALAAAQKYIALEPDNIAVLDVEGECLFYLGKYEEAGKVFDDLCRLTDEPIFAEKRSQALNAKAEQEREQENHRLVEWAEKFYQISRFGAANRNKMSFGFVNLFKDQVLEYKLIDIFQRYDCSLLTAARVLDVGCGEGRFLRKLIDWGANPANLAGVDLNEGIIELARELCAPRINFSVGGGDCLPYDDKTFDVILIMGVLQHIMNDSLLSAVSAECLRVLKDDGIIITNNITKTAEPKLAGATTLQHNTRALEKAELEQFFKGCNVQYDKIMLTDGDIISQVPMRWGTLYDAAVRPGSRECDYGIAVITKSAC